MAKILIVDDEETIRKLLTSAVKSKNHEVIAVEDGFRGYDVFQNFKPDVVVSDIKMPRMTGFQMFEKLKESGCDAPIIFITGHGEKSAAIESLRIGAFDYLEKPFDMEDFHHRLQSAIDKKYLQNENNKLTQELSIANEKLSAQLEAKSELVHRIQHTESKINFKIETLGVASSMNTVKETIQQLSQNSLGTDMGVLITGASGSGKEVAARLVHELSGRSKGPWVPVNCGALPETLIESELFGHEKGAFTGANSKKIGVFELAEGGTLFLDEIGELPLAMQSKLLRVLQEKTFRRVGGEKEIAVDTRVIAATNVNLTNAIKEKTFREDLFYRINTVQIHLPSLKERKEDIAFFAKKMLESITQGNPKAPREFMTECFQLMNSYDWPGNLRELKTVIQRAALASQGSVVTPESIANALGLAHATPIRKTTLTLASNQDTTNTKPEIDAVDEASKQSSIGVPYHQWKKEYTQKMEKEYLQQQLTHFHGNVSALSRFMKVSRPNLCRLLKKHSLKAEAFRDQSIQDNVETKTSAA
ncbi:MAG: sigma-54 dependent transcriptional regulator [Oligoflexia bacterium]|nr:sigma-54 dependent transcriptional regulator [Oligoflexia bacterium]